MSTHEDFSTIINDTKPGESVPDSLLTGPDVLV